MKKILVVEDDQALRDELFTLFEKNQYQVMAVSTLGEATKHLSFFPDLIVLDRNLPDGEGLTWLLQRRKEQYFVPVLLLTARDSTLDKVSGLEMGANDYLTKPFEAVELLARVRVLLGEVLQNFSQAQIKNYQEFQFDPLSRKLFKEGKEVGVLSPIEADCLGFFIDRAGEVFTRDELLERVWKQEAYQATRAVDNVVSELRKYLGAECIETIRGKGYRLVAPKKAMGI